MTLTQNELVELYIKSCPVFYFHKEEPYMPCDFDDILRLSNVNVEEFKINYKDFKMITIPEDKKFNHPVGKQILCKTLGEYMIADKTYIDLMFILTFTWNGTLDPHAYDKEQACVRLQKTNNKWEINSIHVSIHGDGLWLFGDRLDREDNRNVLYVSNESHAIYGRDTTHKRIFGFGNDVCSKDIRWMPTEFVVFEAGSILTENINIYDDKKTLIKENVSYFGYSGKIGDGKVKWPQNWAGSIIFTPFRFRTCDTHQNGIDTLFSDNGLSTGKEKIIKTNVRYFARSVCSIIWLLFFAFIIYSSFIENNISLLGLLGLNSSIYKKLGIFGLQLLIIGILFITGTYIGWEIFILSPINDYKTWNWPIQIELNK
jgi:hypothetical protein